MEKGKMKTKTAVRLLCLALLMVLISCVGASLLQTDFGQVQVYTFKLPTDGGKWVSANLFRPLSATAENPAPLVVASHGGANNKEMQDMAAIELSRRGIAVITIDRYYHGESSPAEVPLFTTMGSFTTAMIPMVEYAWSLDYVDSSRVGVTGHSMGGGSSWMTMLYYGQQYEAALEAARAPASPGGAEITAEEQAAADRLNKVAAGLPNSMASMSTAENLASIHANVGVLQGQYDEGGHARPRADSIYLPTDAELLALVNSIQPEGEALAEGEVGRYYGDAADGTLRVFYNDPGTHPWQHFSTVAAAHTVEFFEKAFDHQSGIPSTNQVWLWKELLNFLGLLGAFLFVVPFASLLLKAPCFANLARPVPPALPALATRKSKLVFWGGWALSGLVSFVSFVPLSRLYTTLGPDWGELGQYGWLLGASCMNYIYPWAIFNGLFGLAWFWLVYRFYGKKNGVDPSMWGIRIGAAQFAKTLGLAVCVAAGFFGLTFAADYFFHTDFRLWFMAVKAFGADKLLVTLPYLVLFFVFYAANSIAVNSANRVSGQKEWVNLLICGLGNVLGVLALELVQYGTLFATGRCYWGAEWLAVLVVMPLIFELFIAAYISRYLFRETGSVWLGALVNCMILVTMGVTNTAILTPLM